jgi:hypothetical protein
MLSRHMLVEKNQYHYLEKRNISYIGPKIIALQEEHHPHDTLYKYFVRNITTFQINKYVEK